MSIPKGFIIKLYHCFGITSIDNLKFLYSFLVNYDVSYIDFKRVQVDI
jgi:hypothetical protein